MVYQILNLENKKTQKPQNQKYIREEGYVGFSDLFSNDKLLCETRDLLLHRDILNSEHKRVFYEHFGDYIISCSKK